MKSHWILKSRIKLSSHAFKCSLCLNVKNCKSQARRPCNKIKHSDFYDKSSQYIKKQRHHFGNKGPCSESYGFSSSHVWMWELDHKKTECWRTDAFKLWCWGKLLRVSCIARRSNQSILKEINPEYSLKGCMLLKFKLQYFGHLMWRADSLEKTLILGKLEGRRRGWQRMRWLDSITNSMDWVWASSGRWWRTGKPGVQANRVLPIERTDHSKQPSSSNTRELYTWTSPDGQYWNKIDYTLCSQRWTSSIQSAKPRPGADCGSDCQFLIAKFNLNWRK